MATLYNEAHCEKDKEDCSEVSERKNNYLLYLFQVKSEKNLECKIGYISRWVFFAKFVEENSKYERVNFSYQKDKDSDYVNAAIQCRDGEFIYTIPNEMENKVEAGSKAKCARRSESF